MKEQEFQQWIQDFYKERGWSGYGPFERMAFLTEEVPRAHKDKLSKRYSKE
ncbi:hypothetical protein [Paenibacillus sp. ATY16]|uniref:hypothetical protein n=1 Tax=Paenibacillus sp. ATY16 TaxID=1759312 RepID=UPI00200C7C61|nr:hypothetical protein [Paenibacillus sp. ATY16]MCK9857731.1 hypothetical protein [Paenibacillus sp. ATY16]